MPIVAPTPIPGLGAVPQTSDPANFDPRADSLLAVELPAAINGMNAAASNVFGNATEAMNAATAAGGSQATASTAASNAQLRANDAAASAATAQAAAAATGGSYPAQTATNGKVLTSRLGVAAWESRRPKAQQIIGGATFENLIGKSSAANASTFTRGSNTSTVYPDEGSPGPNGLRSYWQPNTGPAGNQYVRFSYTALAAGIHTACVWWRGMSKPGGYLIYAEYRDAVNAQQVASLLFSDASVVADGKWRRYSISFNHAGSTLGGAVLTGVDTGAALLNFADPNLTAGGSPQDYVATGEVHVLEPNCVFNVSTTAGPVYAYLPSTALGVEEGSVISVKEYGKAVPAVALTLDRNGALIEDAAQNIEWDIPGGAIELHFSARKGWLIK